MTYPPAPLPLPELDVMGQPTFWGIFVEYYNECETLYRKKGWAESTKEQYDSIVRNIIYPHLANHNYKPIGDYTQEDFDKAIKEISDSGKKRGKAKGDQYDEATLLTFKRLIRTIVTVAYDNGKTLYNVFDDDFDDSKKKEFVDYCRLHNIQPKSFSVAQEHAIAQYLSKTCLDHGESVGLLLMFALGLRCAEATGASFDDIVKIDGYDEFYCLRVLHTTGINSSSLRIGGKTQNANRLIPLPQTIYTMLRQIEQIRKDALQQANIDLASVKMPIACRGKNYLNRCDTPALSRAGRKMFFEIGMRKEYIVSFGLSIEQDHLAAQEMSAEEEFALIEREPTAYAMRRNTATHLYNVGLDENQSSYIMGHKIYDEHIHQKEYSTPELLYEIKKRMALRPIINAISDSVEILQLERNRASSHSGTYEQIIHIPSHSSATIMAIPFIPEDDISITEISENESGIVHVQRSSYVTNTAGRSRHATMLRLYHKMYKDAVGNYVISL